MPSLHGVNDDEAGFGVKGENTTPASLGHFHEAGVVGASQGGVGVFGTSGDISSFHLFGSADIGVQGVSPDGTGVSAISGTGHGVSAVSDSGDGVLGVGKIGVHGRSNSPDNSGVLGENSGGGTGVTGTGGTGVSGTTTGSGIGVSGTAIGPGLGIGVSGASFPHIGVQGSGGHKGVFGTSGLGDGVHGFSDSGTGVEGESGQGDGTRGATHSSAKNGVVGTNDGVGPVPPGLPGGNGVFGFSKVPGASGVYGNHDGAGSGVFGESIGFDGVHGLSHASPHAGVAGINDKGGIGVFGQGTTAGSFVGDVKVTGNLIMTEANSDIILSGGDCAEDFDIAGPETVEPGTVMVIDKEGALRPCQVAYDRKVTGVISGAGNYKPGIVLDKRPSSSNRLPLALVGKVNCKVDARFAPIEVGDLLTTSPTAGHAMKADDPLRALGSLIGKALRGLEHGKGMIPILVALQ